MLFRSEVPAVNVACACPIKFVLLVVTMTGLIDSPVPVEPINSNKTFAPPTGFKEPSFTRAVNVAVLRLVPKLGCNTDTFDCRVIEAALALGELIEKIKLADEMTVPVPLRASTCTLALPALVPGAKVWVSVVPVGVTVNTF